jgi:hypothetical protein
MKYTFTLLATTAMLSLASGAFAADESSQVKSKVDYKKDGGYESTRTTEQTTAAGTEKTSKTKVDVDVDANGNVDKTVKKETVNDPKGMMNKTEENSETRIEEKDNGGYKQTTTRKHKDANGTSTTYKTVTDVNVNAAGNVTSTATTEKTVDPKGLMNETTTKSKTKAVNGKTVN